MMKYWTVGKVKTRLAASIGFDEAAQLHRLFVLHLCQSLLRCGSERMLVFDPPERRSDLETTLAENELSDYWTLTAQSDGSLGRRMQRWFVSQLLHMQEKENLHDASNARAAIDARAAILIGADCPTLTSTDIGQAGEALLSNDVVLGPAADGGYYLIGLRSSAFVGCAGASVNEARASNRINRLFADIPWSTADVMSITMQRINQFGYSVALLPEREDIDTAGELTRLRKHLADARFASSKLRGQIEQILQGKES